MRFNSELTQEVLKQHVAYNEVSGEFLLKRKTHSRDNTRKLNKPLGYLDGGGYSHFSLLGTKYKAHRLAWLYTHGDWPESLIDHIDGDKTNNRLSNLRESTHKQNSANMKKGSNLSGFKGVYPLRLKNGTIRGWMAQYSGKYLGTARTPEGAAAIYDEYVERELGAFAYTNKRMEYEEGRRAVANMP